MSTSDGQPPLTRRQVRDLERAREAGQAVTGATPVVSTPTPAPRSAAPAQPVAAAAPATVDEPASAPTPAPASVVDPGTGLTRRQMRALRDASENRPAEPVPLQAPAPEPRRPLSEALNTVDTIVNDLDEAGPGPSSAPRSVEPADDASTPDPTSASDETGDVPGPRRLGSTGANPSAAPAAVTPAPTSTPTVFPFSLSDGSSTSTGESRSTGPQPSASSAGVRGAGRAAAPVGATPSGPLSSVPASVPGESTSTGEYVVPAGHWSTQSDQPDAESAPARSLGTSTGQQNALILTDAQVADVTGALNATGEIIITGSIDLPRSLASAGSQARIDNSDMDRLLEQGDAEQATSDAEPVRASRAISTHTSTRAVVLAASQPKGNHLPLILGISGGVVGVGIIALIIGGFATGVLG